MTYSVAVLEISPQAYKEIRDKLEAAGYGHLLMDGKVNMSGIAIAPEQREVRGPAFLKGKLCEDCDPASGCTMNCGPSFGVDYSLIGN